MHFSFRRNEKAPAIFKVENVTGVRHSYKSEWYQQICDGESTLADAIMDRISYDSYKIDIESVDPAKDLSMREVYGLDPAMAK